MSFRCAGLQTSNHLNPAQRKVSQVEPLTKRGMKKKKWFKKSHPRQPESSLNRVSQRYCEPRSALKGWNYSTGQTMDPLSLPIRRTSIPVQWKVGDRPISSAGLECVTRRVPWVSRRQGRPSCRELEWGSTAVERLKSTFDGRKNPPDPHDAFQSKLSPSLSHMNVVMEYRRLATAFLVRRAAH